MARRVVFWSSFIAGWLGVIKAINAGLSNQYIGAGVCLVASALALSRIMVRGLFVNATVRIQHSRHIIRPLSYNIHLDL